MSTSANSYVLQRRRADTLTRLRAETLGRLPHTETMAAVLAELDFDLNDCDSVVFGLLEHGFSAREINDTVDAALARAFAIRRDRASEPNATPAGLRGGGELSDVGRLVTKSGVAAGRDRPSNSHPRAMTHADSAPPSPTDGGGALPHSDIRSFA